MALLNQIFTTRTLVQIIVVLTVTLVMKALSAGYLSWAIAPIAG